MDIALFERIVSQWKAYSDYIYLHVLGEPLLHPYLDELLDLCDQYEMKVTLTTNGSLLKEKYQLLLKHKSMRQVNISVHNFKEQNINMEMYVDDVIYVGERLAASQIYVNYRFWNMNDGVVDSQTKEVLSKFELQFDTTFTKNKEKLAEYQFVHFDERFDWPSLSLPFIGERGKCLGTRSQLAVLVDGTLTPCCLDAKGQIPLGSIKDSDLRDLLRGKRYVTMKKGFEDNKASEDLCKHCSFKTRFKI